MSNLANFNRGFSVPVVVLHRFYPIIIGGEITVEAVEWRTAAIQAAKMIPVPDEVREYEGYRVEVWNFHTSPLWRDHWVQVFRITQSAGGAGWQTQSSSEGIG